jgi:transcriptional regulator with XRE-family HTH domain
MATQVLFGDWLRQRRHLLDLTQVQLAEETGCSAVTIRKLEANARKPSTELAQALSVALRIPERERTAFVQFARSDESEASFRLPAWNSDRVTWRDNQLPAKVSESVAGQFAATINYNLVAPAAPLWQRATDGRHIVKMRAVGNTFGDIEGDMEVQITQVIMPKPDSINYSQAVPMQIGVFFQIHSGDEFVKGVYSGTVAPMLDANGTGEARVLATGQVTSVTVQYIDLFLNYTFVTDTVKMVEGVGVGSIGVMQFSSAS